MDAKEQLYYLLKSYVDGNYETKIFCELFSDIYDHEIDDEILNETERKLFGELSIITNRFSPFEEDLKKYKNVYFNEQNVKEKIKEVVEELKL